MHILETQDTEDDGRRVSRVSMGVTVCAEQN